MIQQTIHKKHKRINSLDWGSFVRQTQKSFKKKFKKEIKSREIKKIWDTFLKVKIIDPVVAGKLVKIDKNSTIQVIGKPIEEDKNFYQMLLRGKMVRRDGVIKMAERNPKRKDFIYKIVYKNKTREGKKLYFKADAAFSKQVRDSLNNTNTFYKIDYVNK